MCELEHYEWNDFWCHEPKDKNRTRVLLIGDSITRGYRRYVEKWLGEKTCVDMIATSKALDNPAFKLDIRYFIEQYSAEYSVIHFNNGLHGFHLSTNDYRENLEDMILYIQNNFKPDELILVSSTPVLKVGSASELDERLNTIILDRNKVTIKLAQKHHLKVNDLYSEMSGKSKYRLKDGFHYNYLGQKAQGKIVAGIITKCTEGLQRNF
jgi:hypothetical protein